MKTYKRKSDARRAFIRMGGDAAQFAASVELVAGKWQFDNTVLPNGAPKFKRVAFRPRRYPKVDMSKHKTGAALIAHIRDFDREHHFVPGNLYIIGGEEVRI